MLNLLPPSEKRFLAKEKQKRLFLVLCFEFFIFLACILLVLLAIEFYILGDLASQNFLLQQAQAESQMPEFVRFKSIMRDYNQKLVLTDSFFLKQKLTVGVLDILLGIQRPPGLYFTKFSLQTQPQSNRIKVAVAGFSSTRDSLLIFKNNIEGEEKVESINFSPEAWLSQKNINFNLTLDIINGK